LYHLPFSGEIIPGILPSTLRVRCASAVSCKFAPGEFVELPTARFVAGYSIQLSYGRVVLPA